MYHIEPTMDECSGREEAGREVSEELPLGLSEAQGTSSSVAARLATSGDRNHRHNGNEIAADGVVISKWGIHAAGELRDPSP